MKGGIDLINDLIGYIKFRLTADDVTLCINKLRNSSFAVHNITAEKNIVSGYCHWYSRNELYNFAEHNSYNVIDEERHGIIYLINKYVKRTGVYIGLFIAVIIVVYFSNTVLKIEVYGNESMSDEQVISVMNDYGISLGDFIPLIDIRRSERAMITALDNFSWIGIRASGCRIMVEVSEITEKPELIPTSSPCNVISSRDAQIVDIKNVHMGMLVPMLYDGVKKGDLLISGVVDGKLDHDYYVHAMGEIIGRYNEQISFFQPYSDKRVDYSDEMTRKSLYFFGLRIPLYLNRKIETDYEYDEMLSYLKVFDLNMPIGIIHSEINPYYINEIEYNNEQVRRILDDKIKAYEKNFYSGEDIEIIDKCVIWNEKIDGIEVTVEYIIEGNIGVTQEIMAKY